MIAGGSGITPLFQSMMEIASMKDETIDLIFLFANTTEDDIVLRKELEERVGRIKVHYILSHPPEGWQFLQGRINHEMLKSICPLDDPNTVYMFCGPKPMNRFLKGLFKEHYPQSIFFKF
jgi:cytochrome-b5 reductase